MKKEHEKIVDSLCRELSRKPGNAGYRLPSEHSLAQRFGCSRVTVRTALSTMERDGLIMRLQGKGTFLLNTPDENRRKDPKPETMHVGVAILNTYPRDFHGCFTQGLQDGLGETASVLNVWFLNTTTQKEKEKLSNTFQDCDAYVIVGDYSVEDITWFARQRKPIVTVGMACDQILQCIGGSYAQISFDWRSTYQKAVTLLWEQGYHHPAIILGSEHSAHRERMEGFRDGLRLLGQDPEKFVQVIINPGQSHAEFDPAHAQSVIKNLLKQTESFDAIITCHTEDILGSFIHEHVSIPDDFALLLETSCPNPMSKACGISEMRFDHVLLGKLAGEKLQGQTSGNGNHQRFVSMPAEFIIRENSPIVGRSLT